MSDKNCEEETLETTQISPFGVPAPIISARNHIYLYNDIDTTITRSFITIFDEMILTLLQNAVDNGTDIPVIWIHLNSFGGTVNDGLALIQVIKDAQSGEFAKIGDIKIPIKVGTIIEGEADSCASLVACVGTKGYRYISKYSFSLLHEVRQFGSMGGKTEDLEINASNLKMFKDRFKEIYLENSTLTEKDYEELIKDEKYSTPEELLKYGLVDKII